MPLYALIGHDGPRGLELRAQCRAEHLEKLDKLDRAGRVRFGGPLRDESGDPVGSLVVFEAADLAEARAIAAEDPYVVRGVFEHYEVYETGQVFPRG